LNGIDVRPLEDVQRWEVGVPFWVYGHDKTTGEPAEFFSAAVSETEANREATEQGIAVERVEPHSEVSTSASERAGTRELSRAPQGGFVWLCLCVAQFVSVLGCIAAVVVVCLSLIGVRVDDRQPDRLSVLVVGCCAFCYSVAMYVVFSQAKRHTGA
jgi:hypothetical protein